MNKILNEDNRRDMIDIDLRAIRENYGIKQGDVIEILNVSRQSINTYENAKKMPKKKFVLLNSRFPEVFCLQS